MNVNILNVWFEGSDIECRKVAIEEGIAEEK